MLDEIGHWTEIKLKIIGEYARAYSRLLKAYKLHYVYIDGFAGAGVAHGHKVRFSGVGL
jgi:hypothetical protein